MKWISVKDKLPGNTLEVLVFSTSQCPYIAIWNGKEWRSNLDHHNGIKWVRGLQPEDVTHWTEIEQPEHL